MDCDMAGSLGWVFDVEKLADWPAGEYVFGERNGVVQRHPALV
jgi:hypothetical protein